MSLGPDTQVGKVAVEEVLEQSAPLRRGVGRNVWTANLVSAAATIALGVYVLISAAGFGFGTPAKPGAGLFPAVIGGVFVLLGAIWLVQTLTGRVTGTPQQKAEPGTAFKIIATVVVIVGFALLVDLLGYQLAMLIGMLTLLIIVAKTRWWLTIILAAAMSFGTFALFEFALGVRLPTSAIPFLNEIGF